MGRTGSRLVLVWSVERFSAEGREFERMIMLLLDIYEFHPER